MTHDEYKEASKEDMKYAMKRRDHWTDKRIEATKAEERWQKQVAAIMIVNHRLENLDEKSAFGPKDTPAAEE